MASNSALTTTRAARVVLVVGVGLQQVVDEVDALAPRRPVRLNRLGERREPQALHLLGRGPLERYEAIADHFAQVLVQVFGV